MARQVESSHDKRLAKVAKPAMFYANRDYVNRHNEDTLKDLFEDLSRIEGDECKEVCDAKKMMEEYKSESEKRMEELAIKNLDLEKKVNSLEANLKNLADGKLQELSLKAHMEVVKLEGEFNMMKSKTAESIIEVRKEIADKLNLQNEKLSESNNRVEEKWKEFSEKCNPKLVEEQINRLASELKEWKQKEKQIVTKIISRCNTAIKEGSERQMDQISKLKHEFEEQLSKHEINLNKLNQCLLKDKELMKELESKIKAETSNSQRINEAIKTIEKRLEEFSNEKYFKELDNTLKELKAVSYTHLTLPTICSV
eukprot:TRINITY_DN1089_c0_g1_i18.p1 TRINITY_DN1089_c0_g1~~TRINITY_DN1089_c0_g1_i18.p1  ORF type:complete len:312 (+),score=94.61 TRINITY_DN1089_c0_g1_i18:297-1232(+)